MVVVDVAVVAVVVVVDDEVPIYVLKYLVVVALSVVVVDDEVPIYVQKYLVVVDEFIVSVVVVEVAIYVSNVSNKTLHRYSVTKDVFKI